MVKTKRDRAWESKIRMRQLRAERKMQLEDYQEVPDLIMEPNWYGYYNPCTTAIHIKDCDLQEVYELLCDIPFDIASSQDNEPPNRRHPAIEFIIGEIESRLKAEENK